MAIAIDTVTSAATSAASATLTVAHTCAVGSVLFVGVTQDNSFSDPTGVTYNGSAMTKVTPTANTPANVSIWYHTAPTTGSSQNVVVTFASSSWGTVGAISFTGVDTSYPVGISGGNHQTVADSTPTVTVTTTVDNSWLLDTFYLNDRSRTSTAGAGQTKQWSGDTTAAEGTRGEGSTEQTTTAGSYTMSWSLSGNSTWSIVAVEILPYVAPPPPIRVGSMLWMFQ